MGRLKSCKIALAAAAIAVTSLVVAVQSAFAATAVTLSASPFTPTSTATYIVSFPATTPLVAGTDTISITGFPGTLPATAGSYTVDAQGHSNPVTSVLSATASDVTFTTPTPTTVASTPVIVTISGVTNPGAGNYTTSVATSKDPTPVASSSFSIATPGSLAITLGNNQSVATGGPFAVLKSTLKDNVIPTPNTILEGNVPVLYTVVPGSSGAGADFSGLATATVNTGSTGVATSPVMTANGIAGAFTVTASALGLPVVTFTETNTAAVPGAPTIGTATAGNAQAGVAFSPPASDGGSPITGYTATATDLTTPANGGQTTSGAASPLTVSGLTNGDHYTFAVVATNSTGPGPASAASNTVTPTAAVPGAPTIGTATAGNAQAGVAFSPPASDGGSPITGYTVTVSPGGATVAAGASATSVIVTGLTNGTSYRFTVTATNGAGTGLASASSNSVTPASSTPSPPPVTTGTLT